MAAEKAIPQPVIMPEQEKTETAPKKRRSRKKTVVTQPSKQVEAMFPVQIEEKKEHFGVGDELPTYLM